MTTPTTVQVKLQLRADTAANWTSINPTLLANELGRETDTGKIKIGNGSTAWNSLAYQAWATLPIAVNVGGTGQTTYTNGQLLIGNTTGNTLTKATLTAGAGVAITNGTGTITVAASGIVDAQIAAGAEIAVSKLADGTPRQLLQTDAAGTGVEWASNIDVPGSLDVTGAATFDNNVIIQGDLTVNGTETIINTQTLEVEDKNIIVGKVTTPTDITADGGGITLKGTTDKTINWIDSTDAWTLSEHVNIASAKEYRIAGTKVLDATSLGSAVVSSSLTSVGTIGTGTWQGTTVATGYGGTGQTTYSNGQLLIGKTDGTLAKATLTASTGVTIVNADGSITISATGSGGTVTAVTGTSPIASTGGATPDISIQDGTTAQKGAVQLEDSTSSTSTTKAATPASVKTAYDLANAALPKAGGTITGNLEIGTAGSISFEGATANDFETTIAVVDPTADRTITLPDTTGTIVTTGDTGTVTSTMILDGTIVDGDINASAAIVDTKLATISTAGKVSNSATTATSSNTASAIVARDGSGNFTAGTITAALTGAASSNVLKAGDTMTGVLAVTAGTAALPGLAVSGDTNTGIYSPGADQLAVATNGTQRLTVDSGGITSANGGVFKGDITTYSVDGIALSFVSNVSQIRACRSGGNYGSLAFFTPGANSSGAQAQRAVITSEGLVGIGSTAPQSIFEIYASLPFQSITGIGSGEYGLKFLSGLAPSAHVGGVTYNSSSGELKLAGPQSYNFWTIQTNNQERCRVTTDGKLLVGTSSASGNALLQVAGGIRQGALGGKPDAAGVPAIGETRIYNFDLAAANTWEDVLTPATDGNAFYVIHFRIGVSDRTNSFGFAQLYYSTSAQLILISGSASNIRVNANVLQLNGTGFGTYGLATAMHVTRIY